MPAGHQQRRGRHAGQQHVHLVDACADAVPPQALRTRRVQVADGVVGHAVQAAARALAGDAVVEQGREQRGVAAAAHAAHAHAAAGVHVAAGGQVVDAAQRVQDEVAVRRVAGQVGAHAVGEVVVAGLLLGVLSGRIEQHGQEAEAGERLRGYLVLGVLLARVTDRQHHRGKRPRPVRDEDRGVHLPAGERLEQDVLDPAVAGLMPADRPRVHRRPGVPERHGAERLADVGADLLAQLPPAAGGQEALAFPVAAMQPVDGACDQVSGELGAQVAGGRQRSRHAGRDHVADSSCRKSSSSRHANAAVTSRSDTPCMAANRSGSEADTEMPREASTWSALPRNASARPSARLFQAVVAQERVAVRSRPFGCAQRPPHAIQHLGGLRGQLGLIQCRVDLVGRPAGKRQARRRRTIGAVLPHVDRQAGTQRRRPARLGLLRHLHPYLGEAPRLVQQQLVAPHVRGVVHLQHHVRQRVRAHLDRVACRCGLRRAQEQDLVGLHDALPLAAGVANQQVGVAARLDRRAARRRDQSGQTGEARSRPFVVVADRRVADHADLGVGVPVLEADLLIVDPVAGDAHRVAAGKLQRCRLPALRGNGGDDRLGHDAAWHGRSAPASNGRSLDPGAQGARYAPYTAAKMVSLVASPICSRWGRRPDRRSESRTSLRKPSPRASM